MLTRMIMLMTMKNDDHNNGHDTDIDDDNDIRDERVVMNADNDVDNDDDIPNVNDQRL